MLVGILFSVVFAAPWNTPQLEANLKPLCSDPTAKSCNIDNIKYLGKWYEIGRSSIIRNTFERNCNCVTADYKLKLDRANILVTNTCLKASNLTLDVLQGNGGILGNGSLKVDFGGPPIPGNDPNYIVSNVWVDSDGNYKRSLVTSGKDAPPNAQFIWILSRDPIVSDDDKADYLAYGRSVGYDPEGAQFERTPCSEDERPLNP